MTLHMDLPADTEQGPVFAMGARGADLARTASDTKEKVQYTGVWIQDGDRKMSCCPLVDEKQIHTSQIHLERGSVKKCLSYNHRD